MHQGLRLGRTSVEYASRVPDDLQDMGVVCSLVVPPAYEACIVSQVFHANMLFDADGEAVEWSDEFPMFRVVVIERFSSG